ncbi:hypothetical protein, partial [Vibrio aestuarianus]
TEADVVLNLGVSTDDAYSAEAGDVGGLSVSYEQGGQTFALAVDPNGNVTVPAGVTAIRVVVATTPDEVYEGDETFGLVVTDSNN